MSETPKTDTVEILRISVTPDNELIVQLLDPLKEVEFTPTRFSTIEEGREYVSAVLNATGRIMNLVNTKPPHVQQ